MGLAVLPKTWPEPLIEAIDSAAVAAVDPAHSAEKPLTCEIFPGEKSESDGRTSDGRTFVSLNFKLDPDTEFRLRKLKQKLEKQRKQALTFNQVIKYMLNKLGEPKGPAGHGVWNGGISEIGGISGLEAGRPSGLVGHNGLGGVVGAISAAASSNANNVNAVSALDALDALSAPTFVPFVPAKSRHIPASERRKVDNSYRGKCGFLGCNRPADEYHHIERFALTKNHSASNLIPLCKAHHHIAHADLVLDDPK